MHTVIVPRCERIPLLGRTDVLVIGGALGALAAAERLAAGGRSVRIVTSDTFLGFEIARWQRPWVRRRQEHRALLEKWLDARWDDGREGDILPLHMDRMKIRLEDIMLESGAAILYASQPVGIHREGGDWCVVAGNKSGRQALLAGAVVDATEQGTLGYIMDPPGPSAARRRAVVRKTLQFTGVSTPARTVEVPVDLGVWGGRIDLYPGAFDGEHVIADIPIGVRAADVPTVCGDTALEARARRVSLETAAYLRAHVPGFEQAVIGLGSLQVMGDDDFDPAEALLSGAGLAERIEAGEDLLILRPSKAGNGHWSACEACGIEYREYSDSAQWFSRTVAVPPMTVPVLSSVDVLVAGGGTSGAAAAWRAGCEGAGTAVVDMNPGLGGTGTFGGVSAYWFGKSSHTCSIIDEQVDAWCRRTGYPNRFAVWGQRDAWSVEVKAHVLEQMCADAGVQVLTNCLAVGALLRDGRVAGVVAATPYGPAAVLSRAVVDATGDGDIAAFAGAPFEYGSGRDAVTLWSSLAQYSDPGGYVNNFSTMADVGHSPDYTRRILEGRRQQVVPLWDHGCYLAPRETRHIAGLRTVTLEDVLLQRRYDDTVAVFFSNFDAKGAVTADIVHMGLLPPQVEIAIPYGSMIPRELDGLIVAGRAIGCTHDAQPAIRMQRDMQTLGAAAGLAAAMAAATGAELRHLPVEALQRRLAADGDLPAEHTGKAGAVVFPDPATAIGELTPEQAWRLDEDLRHVTEGITPVVGLCLMPGCEAVPPLEDAYRSAEGPRRLLLARLLLWHGCAAGLSDILGAVAEQLDAAHDLPRRPLPGRRTVTMPPDHGAMPETAHLLYALARGPADTVAPTYRRVVSCIEGMGRDYADPGLCLYHYVGAVAYAAERLSGPQFASMAERLLALPEFRDPEAGRSDTRIAERLWMLKLLLTRALARCGSRDGLLGLWALTRSRRHIIARSALAELQTLTGCSEGIGGPWAERLEGWPKTFPARPLSGNTW